MVKVKYTDNNELELSISGPHPHSHSKEHGMDLVSIETLDFEQTVKLIKLLADGLASFPR